MAMVQPLVSEFTVIGQLEDFISKSDNSIKYLQLVTEQEDFSIKVAKELQSRLGQNLQPGCWLKVTGMRKYELHKGEVKYKAYRVEVLTEKSEKKVTLEQDNKSQKTKPKAKVLFCQKSTCWKKGGKATCQTLKNELQQRGIAEKVEIKTVGCLKQCKKAPNIVIMPDKARYHNVKPKQVSLLITKHLLSN